MYALSIQQKAGIMRCSRFHSKSSNPSNPCYLIHLKPRRRKTRTSHDLDRTNNKLYFDVRSWYEVMRNTQIFLFELTKD